MLYFKKARSGAPSGILEQGSGTQCRKERHSAAFLSPRALYFLRTVCYGITVHGLPTIFKAIPHNSKCRYGERGATAAKPKAQIILDAAKVSAASGGNSEPKHDAGTATRHYRAFWQRRCRAAAAGAVLKPLGGNCAVLPYILQITPLPTPPPIWLRWRRWQAGVYSPGSSFAAY